MRKEIKYKKINMQIFIYFEFKHTEDEKDEYNFTKAKLYK